MTRFLSFKVVVKNLINECSLCTKCIIVLLLSLYICSFKTESVQYLTIIPGYFLPSKFWIFSLLTFSFFESRLLFILLDTLTIFFIEKLLLEVWGWLELIKFCALVNCLSAVCSVFMYIFLYAVTYNELYLFHTYINGMMPLFAALTVASRQLMGDNIIITFKFGKIRNKHISMTCLFVLIILVISNITCSSVLIMYVNGLYISWLYLRFFQKHNDGNIGDLSDKFAFSDFFPYHLEGPVSVITNSIFGVLIYLKICKKIDRRYDVISPTKIEIPKSVGVHIDSESRKQFALKALNDRLNETDKTVLWPSMDDEKESKEKEVKESNNDFVSENTTADISNSSVNSVIHD